MAVDELVNDLTMAAHLGNLERVRKLLAKGVPIDAMDSNGRTALMAAVGGVQLEVLDFLLRSGANPNLRCIGDKGERMKTFEEWRELARRQVVGFQGATALISCAEKDEHFFLPFLKELLAAGADPNISDIKGRTPLHEAAWRGHKEIIKALLQAGADIDARDIYGYTPLMKTYRDYDNPKYLGAARLFREAGADEAGCESCALEWACYRPSLAGVHAALEQGADVNFINDSGHTAMRRAVISRHRHKEEAREIIELLLARGADPNLHDPGRGMPPMFPAIEYGDGEVVKILLDCGADPCIKWGDVTAMRYALAHRQVEIQELLIAAGAPAPDLKKERGLRQRDGNFAAVLVRKGIAEVSAALAGAGEIETGIQGRKVEIGKRALLIYQLKGHVWTVVERVGRGLVNAGQAEELSRNLDCPAIFLNVSDTAELAEYSLYEGGELVEQFYHGPQRGATDLETAMATEWEWTFTSKRKKGRPARHLDPREVVHLFLKRENAFYSVVPGLNGDGTLTVFEGPAGRMVIRADLVRNS